MNATPNNNRASVSAHNATLEEEEEEGVVAPLVGVAAVGGGTAAGELGKGAVVGTWGTIVTFKNNFKWG